MSPDRPRSLCGAHRGEQATGRRSACRFLFTRVRSVAIVHLAWRGKKAARSGLCYYNENGLFLMHCESNSPIPWAVLRSRLPSAHRREPWLYGSVHERRCCRPPPDSSKDDGPDAHSLTARATASPPPSKASASPPRPRRWHEHIFEHATAAANGGPVTKPTWRLRNDKFGFPLEGSTLSRKSCRGSACRACQ